MSKKTNILRLGLAGLNQIPLDWNGNLSRIRQAVNRARVAGVDLLCLPELAITGYGCEDFFFHPHVCEEALEVLRELAEDTGDDVLLAGLPVRHEGELYNAVGVLNRGRIAGLYLKSFLARDGIHYEPRWFRPWPPGRRDEIELFGETVAVGTLSFATDCGFRFGIEICEDAWVDWARRPCRLVERPHFIFNASASHFSLYKADERERILRETTGALGIGYGYANLVGCESGRAIYDGELLFARDGEIVNRSKRLYLDDVEVLTQDFRYSLANRDYAVLLGVTPKHQPPAVPPRTHRQARDPHEEFAMAATLALFDYMRKSRSRGFILSLSGGVDSGAAAVLVWMCAQRVWRELDQNARESKLAYFPELAAAADANSAMRILLTTVYQSTRNSGDVTRNAAAGLAETIGANHLVFDVDPLVVGYREMVERAIERPLTWKSDDIALQNIQARSRGPGVWMLANLANALLLTTSNRSEVAVGYATMDGDTCGGLAPIAGVEKTFLRSWLQRVQTAPLLEFPALPVLEQITSQPPTAELRPVKEEQNDEADLMPYPVLDALEEQLVSERRTPIEAYRRLREHFAEEHDAATIKDWTIRFCRLFATSQWKRERYAPAFHLDDSNLDPKTWARFPILSGCFERELQKLAALPD